MNLHLRKMRLKARPLVQGYPPMSHEEWAEKGRALGLPAFCNGWQTETLIRKVTELENGN